MQPRARARGVILLYHRVASPRVDPWDLAVTPEHFQEHMEVLRWTARPLPLRSVVAAGARSLPERSVVVTFDDGYHDNLASALPVLELHRIPATFFLTGDTLGEGKEFWWDALARQLLHPPALPPELRIAIKGRERVFRLDVSQRTVTGSRAGQPPAGPRERTYLDLWHELAGLHAQEREPIIAAIDAWSGSPGLGDHSHRTLSAAEVRNLADSEMVEIGAHTLTHARLSNLTQEEQRYEIIEGRRRLEAVVGRAVTSFSYPFGRPGDYSETTVRLVREAGFHSACANTQGGITPHTDLWRLPRVYVRDCDGRAFAELLLTWFP